ncbi:hypothetical protein EST38_g2402 [Candolleomyces aberdarensis]|uniref:RanBD1 domain-containing protein n=1 Tax=Candolleomyces aberdarensis TaxID=2316362 RepID=A0A4Q2DUQ8_9AGAR|nr:hypothetical protein EST38_g2402 [Candolleomyces aberdarensis]
MVSPRAEMRIKNDSDRDEEMAEDEKHALLKSRHLHHHQEEDCSHPNDVAGANGEHGDTKDDIVTDHEQDHDPIHVDNSQEESQATRPNTPDPTRVSPSLPNIVHDQEVLASDKEGVIPTAPVSREPTGAEHLAVSSELTGRSDSDAGAEKGLKRKYLERGTSQGPPETSKADDGAAKEGDAVEDSQASPPPETQPVTERTSPPSPKIPKLSGFMAYASSSSPFASVKGNVFASSSKASSASSTPSTSSAPKLGESSNLSSSPPKRSGFEAFASAASPFASVSRDKTPAFERGPNNPPLPSKRSGFEAFSASASGGSASPSRLGRAKSPAPRRNNSFNSNPFASYVTGGAQAFGASHASKRARAESPAVFGGRVGSPAFGSAGSATAVFGSSSSFTKGTSGSGVFGVNDNEDSAAEEEDEEGTSFGDRLRNEKGNEDEDEEDSAHKMNLEEQEVITGEEDEQTIMQVRGKLFTLDGNNWKERGTGILRLNVRAEDGANPRLVMRKDAVYTLLLNVTLFPGMRCTTAQDPRYVRFSVIEDKKTTHYNLRVANAKIASEFLEEVNSLIPSA